MHHLLRKQIILHTFVLVTFTQALYSQTILYREDRDNKPYYFGLSLGAVSATLLPSKTTQFLANDSIMVAEPANSAGYSVRLLATLKLNNRFELRANPGLIL